MSTPYKKYWRKTSLESASGNLLLNIIAEKKPKNFLEIGVFTGITARNVCELLNTIHQGEFNYTGLDLFENYSPELDSEIVPDTIRGNKQKFSNPLKHLFYNLILNEQVHSLGSVSKFLKKFNHQVKLVKGDTKKTLPEQAIEKFDMIFVDGGHSFETVYFELRLIVSKCKNHCLVLVDDYNHNEATGVKIAVDKIVFDNKLNFKLLNNRVAQISKF